MTNDLFVLDTERFNSLTSDEILQQGLAYFSEHRVIALDKLEDSLSAQVADPETEIAYRVEIQQGNRAKLNVTCGCNNENLVCKHAIAALYSYNAAVERREQQLNSAAQESRQACIQKGKHQIRVKLISGNLGFGVWQATSALSAPSTAKAYQVHLRSLTKPVNYCTCPDLERLRLGTCQHIEGVLHYVQSKPEYQALQEAGSPVSFVYLAWENNKPSLRLFPVATISNELTAICAEYFSPSKLFTGHMPGDFYRFAERVHDRDDFHIGEDAQYFAQQCVKKEAQAHRAEQINQEILRTQGNINGIKARLLPYQTDGAAFLASHGRALLADDMGLGKSLQSIVAACCLADYGDIKKVLVVSPEPLKYHWAREIKKFSPHSATIIQGNSEIRALQYQSDALFTIVTYEVLLRDISQINSQLEPDLLILDEIQRIKNWRTRIIPKLRQIPYSHIFALSSLALDKNLNDLYSLLQVVDPHLLAPAWRYLLDYQITDEQGLVIGNRNLHELHKRIASAALRRNYVTVSQELLEKTEVHLDIPLDKKQRELHDTAMSHAIQLAQLANEKPLTPGEQHRLIAHLQQTRMACNAAGLIDKETQGSPKLHELSYLLEHLCLHNQHKTVVFSQWLNMTEMVESLAQQMGLACVHLHGSIASEERTALINQFKKDPNLLLMIATDAGSTGLSLHAATVLVNLDMPWNPAILEQRIARVYKSGQKNKLLVFSMLAEDAYEQQVTKLIKSKRNLFDNISSPENADDVVGISKKMLQTLIEALTNYQGDNTEISQPQGLRSGILSSNLEDTTDEPLIQPLLEKIQLAFKHRLQKTLGCGKGLLIVVNTPSGHDENIAQQLSQEGIPVAIIDCQTLTSLKRLEAAAPLTALPLLYEGNGQPTINPLVQLADAKLNSAKLLLAQQASAGVLDLLASALLLQAAALVGQFQAPALDTVAIWLHSEILPQQLLSQEQANVLLRVVSLAQSQDVPFQLIEQAVVDAGILWK